LLDAQTGERINDVVITGAGVFPANQVTFLEDGRVLAGMDRTQNNLVIWDGSTEPALRQIDDTKIASMGFQPDTEKLVIIGRNYAVTVLDFASGATDSTLNIFTPPLNNAEYSPESHLVTATDVTGNVWMWDTETGELIRMLPATANANIVESEVLLIEPTRQYLLMLGFSHIEVYNLATGEMAYQLNPVGVSRPGEFASPTAFGINPDGTLVAVGSVGYHFTVWDLTTGTLVAQPKGHTDSLYKTAFVDNGNRILTVSKDGTLRFWGLE
jgi:WD40 repeat protein